MNNQSNTESARERLRKRLHTIIFEADTPAGRVFDLILLGAILISVVTVMLESVEELGQRYGYEFHVIEWVMTVLFTFEYALRLYCVRKPMVYARSFYGIVDLVSILPTYLSLFFSGAQMLLAIRALRLLRIFRVLKLVYFLAEARILLVALRASRGKIVVFLFFVVLLVTIIGAIMYLVEGQENSEFRNIPVSIYWAIVTLTTVGFGDITPETNLGRFLSAIVMILGYAVIAVPTGIMTMELIKNRSTNTQACPNCGAEGHDDNAKFCKFCGSSLDVE
jgi:voltage-gated potassium channel